MKVHFTTLGCPKNQVDSELMLGMLTQAGHEIAERPEAAECLVVNPCAFIDRARQESVNTILALAQLKERGPARALIVPGRSPPGPRPPRGAPGSRARPGSASPASVRSRPDSWGSRGS